MSNDQWQRMQDLFLHARALDANAREAFIANLADEDVALASEVRSLLAADATRGPMDVLAPRLASLMQVVDDTPPERIGPYRIVRELGRGGMGAVYLAERADGQFEQQVAIKLIGANCGDDPLHQRFLEERRILAGLVHHGIARLYDGGFLDDGRPYLVLEYVDGLPVTAWCSQQRLCIRDRLRVFVDVCAAVQHAHQRLVIHRDLKPSNILVSKGGHVHLLDFGIATLIANAVTGERPIDMDRLPMTPAYASPEQVHGEPLTTASDVYSLGVLLYELLCGQSPYHVTGRHPSALLKAIVWDTPESPSVRAANAPVHAFSTTPARLARELRGDLDRIVAKAMHKDPTARYASVDVLRQDIERRLDGRPVLAQPDRWQYRLGKFVRRHRVEAGAAALTIIALTSGLTLALQEGRRANRERARAEQALAQSERVTDFMMELFRSGDIDDTLDVSALTARDLLQRGVQRANALADQPVVQARLLDVVGQMSWHLGQLDDAQRLLEQAVALRRQSAAASPETLASSLLHLSHVHRTRNEIARARELVQEALSLREKALPSGHVDIADALYELGWVSSGPEQEQLYQRAVAMLPDTGAAAATRALILQSLSTSQRRQGRFDEALASSRDALQVARTAFGPTHHATGQAMVHLADHVRDLEYNAKESERLYRDGLALIERTFGEQSVRLLHGLHSLGTLLSRNGDAEAEQVFRRAIAIRRSATGPAHPQVAQGLQLLAGELLRQNRLTEAESVQRQALAHSVRTLGPEHPVVVTERQPHLAMILLAQGRDHEADTLFNEVFTRDGISLARLGELHREYGRLLLARGEFTRAESHQLQALGLLQRHYARDDHPNVIEAKRALMRLYEEWKQPVRVAQYRVPPGQYFPY